MFRADYQASANACIDRALEFERAAGWATANDDEEAVQEYMFQASKWRRRAMEWQILADER